MRPGLSEAGLVVFLRLPEKGKVKTRLAATLGDEAALHIYKELVSLTLQVAGDIGIQVYLYYEGGLPLEEDRNPSFTYHLQSTGDLGLKMAHALSFVLRHHNKAVIIGSDCPDLTTEILRQSLRFLDETDFVLGPAHDGGYYLLGCKKIYPSLFEKIAWSTTTVLRQTIEKITQENISFRLLPQLADVDTADDWNRYSGKRQ